MQFESNFGEDKVLLQIINCNLQLKFKFHEENINYWKKLAEIYKNISEDDYDATEA